VEEHRSNLLVLKIVGAFLILMAIFGFEFLVLTNITKSSSTTHTAKRTTLVSSNIGGSDNNFTGKVSNTLSLMNNSSHKALNVPAKVMIFDSVGRKLYSGVVTGKKALTLKLVDSQVYQEYDSPVGGITVSAKGFYTMVIYDIPLNTTDSFTVYMVPKSDKSFSSAATGGVITSMWGDSNGTPGLNAYISKISKESGISN